MTSVTVISSTGDHFAMPLQIYWDKIIPVSNKRLCSWKFKIFHKKYQIRQRKERKKKPSDSPLLFLKTDPQKLLQCPRQERLVLEMYINHHHHGANFLLLFNSHQQRRLSSHNHLVMSLANKTPHFLISQMRTPIIILHRNIYTWNIL